VADRADWVDLACDRELLTAPAYARAAGLDDTTWLAFTSALGYDATVADLDVLRRSPAADYLLQMAVSRWYGVRVFTDTVASDEPVPDEATLVAILRSEERAGRTPRPSGRA
jgi:hypothetical protein